ncbi:MAG TPA: GNAT family N-acetyltransferase [Flavobacterium sp.]|nr:GNAT family N-acetyltransferase [Flavobacterium sp.]
MNIQIKAFNDFSAPELYEVLSLRNLVFVVEQNCAYLDTDGDDHNAHHVLVYDDTNELIAYARIFKPEIKYKTASIGRVVVHPNHRGKHLGDLLINHSINAIQDLYRTSEITLSAQAHLQFFYNKHGFVTVSDAYLEDDIPHVEMQRK